MLCPFIYVLEKCIRIWKNHCSLLNYRVEILDSRHVLSYVPSRNYCLEKVTEGKIYLYICYIAAFLDRRYSSKILVVVRKWWLDVNWGKTRASPKDERNAVRGAFVRGLSWNWVYCCDEYLEFKWSLLPERYLNYIPVSQMSNMLIKLSIISQQNNGYCIGMC